MQNINDHHLALEFDKVLSNLSKYANTSLAKNKCLNLKIFNQKEQIEYELPQQVSYPLKQINL